MPDTWITDITHFLEDGRLPAELARPARRLAEYIGSIILGVTSSEPDDPIGVRCRRRPGRKPCAGEVAAFIDPDSDRIFWKCVSCGDNGVISNWRDTFWDCRGAEVTDQAHSLLRRRF